LFGATVTFEDASGKKKTFTIVGIDEVDAAKGRISWVSPLARALHKAKVGDVVSFRSPKGVEDLEILKIEFQ
jgi:transcription elongation factor GreB